MRLLAAALLAVAPTAALSEPLNLICAGVARTTEATQTYGSAYAGGETASGSATTYRKVRTEETLRIQIQDGGAAGRVKLPRTLIPPISIGKEGWWDFVKLEVGEDAIRGQISLNMINKPKIVVDRKTGEVDLTGFGMTFNGNCERAPDEPEGRKF